MTSTLSITGLPVSVINRALELYGDGSETTAERASAALLCAEETQGGCDFLKDGTMINFFARAVAEYISGSGPWSDAGERADEGGYGLTWTP